MMDWDDVDEILFDGTEEQIRDIKCPECGGKIEFSYCHETRGTETRCLGCYTVIRGHKAYKVPNFALFGINGTSIKKEGAIQTA